MNFKTHTFHSSHKFSRMMSGRAMCIYYNFCSNKKRATYSHTVLASIIITCPLCRLIPINVIFTVLSIHMRSHNWKWSEGLSRSLSHYRTTAWHCLWWRLRQVRSLKSSQGYWACLSAPHSLTTDAVLPNTHIIRREKTFNELWL